MKREDAGAPSRSAWAGDGLAGLTTALMLVPQAMAYALLAGLPPRVGLCASAAPILIYAALGRCSQLAVGPVAVVSLLTLSALSESLGPDASAADLVARATSLMALVGVFQIAMSLLRVGALVRFLTRPIVVGYAAAAALIIAASQLRPLLGLAVPRSQSVFAVVGAVLARLGEARAAPLVIGLGGLLVLALLKRLAPRAPRPLIVIVLAAIAARVFGLGGRGLDLVGSVPGGLPSLAAPPLSFEALRGLALPAAIIAAVGALESISVATIMAERTGAALRPGRELFALGAANLGGSLFGGYPVSGGLSRTVVNAEAGAVSRWASVVTAGVVLVSLAFLTPLFAVIPKAALAAIVISAVVGLVDWKSARRTWSRSRADGLVLALTFAATLSLGVQLGILSGLLAQGLAALWRRGRPGPALAASPDAIPRQTAREVGQE